MRKRIIGACLASAVAMTVTGGVHRIEGRAISQEPPKPALAAIATPVEFDPCTDISGSTLRSSGLNPSTEMVADDVEGPAVHARDLVDEIPAAEGTN